MHNRHARVIINPVAGGGVTLKRWPQMSELLKGAGLTFDHDFTEGPGHAIQLAGEAVEKGYGLVISVGGDGTVNEVVNGLVDETGKGKATLGIISMGTGSDAARTLGIPQDWASACRLFSSFKTVSVDVGQAEYTSGGQRVQRLYFNTAGMGFDAAVSARQTKLPGSMRGTIPYVTALVLTLGSYRNKTVTVDIEGEREEQRVFTIVVNNGRYFGGGMKVAPDADVTDGLLDVIAIGDMSKPEFLWNFPRVYKGTHISHRKVSARQVRGIEIASADEMLLQLDGDLMGEAPASFRVLPAALTVAV